MQLYLPAVNSRSLLAWCHAELGTFAEGRAVGEEGLQIAEAVDASRQSHGGLYGVGLLALRQGDLHQAPCPGSNGPWASVRTRTLPTYFPWVAAALGEAYALGGRVADAVPLLDTGR